MPEPLLYLKAAGAAAIASAAVALAMLSRRRNVGSTWRNLACAVAIATGLVIGNYTLSLQPAWPPRNGLDRLLTVVVPMAIGVELIATLFNARRYVGWLLRFGLAAIVPRILLHDSVYLNASGEWTSMQAFAIPASSGILLGLVWSLLSWLSERGSKLSVPLSICMATQCAGVTVMMAGYIKGGEAAIPLVATLLATAVVAWQVRNPGVTERLVPAITVGVGIVALFGILFVGRFFGRLPSSSAMAMLLAPLLCGVSELRLLRQQKPWVVAAVQLALVAVPLSFVLVAAKQVFERDMLPLLVKLNEASAMIES